MTDPTPNILHQEDVEAVINKEITQDEILDLAAPKTVVASGTTHSDPGFATAFAFAGDHSAMSDVDFLHLVQRNYRVVQTGPPGTGSSGFGSCPLWISAADASAGTISVQTLDASVPFEVVEG